MGKCFVIQPFDNGKFDKRYKDTYKPAIEDCGLEAYRVDKDSNSVIPIDDIDREIRQADMCLAEITENNPNVWFELGLAIAYKKDVILICSEERTSPFPFDVQHRKIIKYSTQSISDYSALKQEIKETAKAYLNKKKTSTVSASLPMMAVDLEPHEKAVLITIASMDDLDEGTSSYVIKREVEGFTPLAVNLGLKKLVALDYLESAIEQHYDGTYTSYKITNAGMQWLMSNRDSLPLVRIVDKKSIGDNVSIDTPFY